MATRGLRHLPAQKVQEPHLPKNNMFSFLRHRMCPRDSFHECFVQPSHTVRRLLENPTVVCKRASGDVHWIDALQRFWRALAARTGALLHLGSMQQLQHASSNNLQRPQKEGQRSIGESAARPVECSMSDALRSF